MAIETYQFNKLFNSELALNTTTAGNQWQPVVVSTSNGAAIVFYVSGDVLKARALSTTGIPTGAEFTVSSGIGATDPDATRLANGNVVITWQDGTTPTKTLGRIYRPDLTPVTGVLTFLSDSTASAQQPSVSATADGGFVIASTLALSGSDSDIYTLKFDANGSLISFNSAATSSTVDQDPSVTVLSNGNIAVAWERVVGSETEIWYAIYAPTLSGAAVLAPKLLDTVGTRNLDVNLTAQKNGGFVLTYSQNGSSVGGTGATNLKSYLVTSSGIAAVSLSAAESAGDNAYAQTATSTDGNIIIVDEDRTNAGATDIRGTLITEGGARVALDVLLESLDGSQFRPDVTWVDPAIIQVVYSTFQSTTAGDGNGFGVAVSRFAINRTITGDSTAEVLVGDGFWDIINGLGGDDVLAGLGGLNTLDGGDGTDTAGYTGIRSYYVVSKSVSFGYLQTTDLRANSPDGTDFLYNVEKLNFNGATTSVETFTPRNFNGDLKSDLLWYNDATGMPVAFLMDGLTATSGVVVGPANGAAWDLVATGDLNGDAQSDMIWQNTSSGDVVGYIMNGTSIASAAVIGSPGASFKIVGVGDLNADGNSDIVLQDGNGQAVAWLMNGTTIQSAVGIGPANGAAWSIKAIGDLNGDSRADLVWQNTDGSTVGYIMNGGSIVAANQIGGALGADWSVKGIGDLNGDFAGDIVWQYSNGQAGVWLMNGTSIAAAQGIGAANGSQFEIRDIADLNGDARMDLVWENMSTGQAVGFLMNGSTILGAANIGGANGSDWKIV